MSVSIAALAFALALSVTPGIAPTHAAPVPGLATPGPTAPAQTAESATAASSAGKVSAKTLLSRLTVRNESSKRYSRAKFTHWVDANRNGCNTRAEVLKSESKIKTTKRGTCTISTGKWLSMYDGRTVRKAKNLDIDHFVPLAEAWRSGAHAWNSTRRQAFANDLGYSWSLIAVTSRTNRHKSDSDPAEWLPARRVCSYVSGWVAVKYRWKLSVDSWEKRAINEAMASCSPTALMVKRPGTPKISKLVERKRTSSGGGSAPKDVYYENCTAARRAGVTPIYRGQPGYGSHLDRDGDGVACE